MSLVRCQQRTGQFHLHVTNLIPTETLSAANALGALLCTNSLLSKNNTGLLLISNFGCVLNVVCFLLDNSPTSEFYMPTFGTLRLFHLHTYPHMKMEHGVPKRWHIKFRWRGITQKKACNIGLFACHELRYLVGNKLCVSIQMSVVYDVLSCM